MHTLGSSNEFTRFAVFFACVFFLAASQASFAQQPAPKLPPFPKSTTQPAANFQRPTVADHLAEAARYRKLHEEGATEGSLSKTPAELAEAKAKEALALVRAAWLGDESAAERREALVAQVRNNPLVTGELRYRVAASNDNRKLSLRVPYAERMGRLEDLARRHVAEFAGQGEAYATLMQIGEDSPDDARAFRIASDIAASAAAAEPVKQRARQLMARHQLTGKPLNDLLGAPLASDTQNKIVIIYSWSASSKLSQKVAARLAEKAPAGAVLIGVNLDNDVATAKAVASADKLPGKLIYDAGGKEGTIAKRLVLSKPGLVYVALRNGRVQSVSIAQDLRAKVEAISKL